MSSKVAALYIRVSTEDQTELSPDAQKRLLLDYAQKNDMIVSGDFIFTESVSGRHAHPGPQTKLRRRQAQQRTPFEIISCSKPPDPLTDLLQQGECRCQNKEPPRQTCTPRQ